MCIAIYTERSLRRIGNLFLASLAIADLFVASLVMTFAGVNDILGENPIEISDRRLLLLLPRSIRDKKKYGIPILFLRERHTHTKLYSIGKGALRAIYFISLFYFSATLFAHGEGERVKR